MNMATKNTGAMTPVKEPHGFRSKNQDSSKHAENLNPNVSRLQSPVPKPSNSNSNSNSPVVKSAKSHKSLAKNPNPVAHSPQNKIRQRKFVVAKKNPKKKGDPGLKVACKCSKEKVGGNENGKNKCLCVAYENLRASQEEFFKNRGDGEESKACDRAESVVEEVIEASLMIQDLGIDEDGCEGKTNTEGEDRCSVVKRRRERLMEEGRECVPQSGSGKVMHLVKAFEKLLSVPSSKELDQKEEKQPQEEENNKAMKWTLPGLQLATAPETEVSGSSFCPSELVLTSQNLGLDPRSLVSSSWDSSRGSVSSRTSTGGRRSRRNSLESSSTFGGRRWKKKQLKVTSQKPFKLRTEQRGKLKEEEFIKKIQEMMTEEEKQRMPIAQGLPWTTDEPECLLKPSVKESTRPIDLKLHSDVRAMDRAEFDHQVEEKLSIIEQYKLERERQQKLAEEEEIRRLRKELIPKAQPMPYFDRPFLPRRSMKNPTIPREPKFHIPHHKKIKCSLSSWTDMSLNSSYLN